MSRPVSFCLRTHSPMAARTRAWKAGMSDKWPCSLAMSISSRSLGRGRLPQWVVRIRCVLRFIVSLLIETQAQRQSGDAGHGWYLPWAPGLLDLEKGAQSTVKRRGSAGNQRSLKDFKQFFPGCAEAYGPPHVGHQGVAVRTPERQEGDGHEFAHLGRDVAPLTQGQLVNAVVGLGKVRIRPGRQFPLGIDVSPRRPHARDELLCLRGSVVVT